MLITLRTDFDKLTLEVWTNEGIDPVDAVKRINLGNQTFIVDEYDFRGKLRKGFFIVVDTGTVNLYMKKTVEFRDRELPTATKYLGEPPRFIKGPDAYYVKFGTDIPQKFTSFDNLISKFPERKEELTQFVKKKKLASRKAADILEFVRYCNSKETK